MQRCHAIWEHEDFIILLADTINRPGELYRGSRVSRVWRDPFLSRLWKCHGDFDLLIGVIDTQKPKNSAADEEKWKERMRYYGRWIKTLTGGGSGLYSVLGRLSIAGTPEDCRSIWGLLQQLRLTSIDDKLPEILDLIPTSPLRSLEIGVKERELHVLRGCVASIPHLQSLTLRRLPGPWEDNRDLILNPFSGTFSTLKNLQTVCIPVILIHFPVVIELGSLKHLYSLCIDNTPMIYGDMQVLTESLRLLALDNRAMFTSLQILQFRHLFFPHLSLEGFRASLLTTLELQITGCSCPPNSNRNCAADTIDQVSQFKTLKFLTIYFRSGEAEEHTSGYYRAPSNVFKKLQKLTNLERLHIQHHYIMLPFADLVEATSRWSAMEELTLDGWAAYEMPRHQNLNVLPSLIHNMPRLSHLKISFDHFSAIQVQEGTRPEDRKLKKLTFALESFRWFPGKNARAVARFLAKYVQDVEGLKAEDTHDYFWSKFEYEWPRAKREECGTMVAALETEDSDEGWEDDSE